MNVPSKSKDSIDEQAFPLLRTLTVKNFRAFSSYTLSFLDSAYLAGPNNAGKSSLLMAIRLAQTLLRHAWTKRSISSQVHDGIHYPCYPVNLRDYPALAESIRHEFADVESSISLTWRNQARMTVVWPAGDGNSPFFYLTAGTGATISSPTQARRNFPRLGIVPALSPLDHNEQIRDDKYVRVSSESKLASRHFRNQLRGLEQLGEWERFAEWMSPWLPEIAIEAPRTRMETSGAYLDVFFHETGSRVPKELVWAGDGIQIWLQILFYVYKNLDCATLVLDEPEVFLHPDLQRRLVSMLTETGKQVVLATHSAEVIAEVDAKMVALVDKGARRSTRAKTDDQMQTLSHMIGSAFNLRLAKALRASTVVFVEGQDMRILRSLARTMGLRNLATETGVSIVPLGGYSSWGHVPAFGWLAKSLLPGAINLFVILDRDYHSELEIGKVESELQAAGISAHVWKRKELESYLITPRVLASVARTNIRTITGLLDACAEDQRYHVFSQLAAHASKEGPSKIDMATVISESQVAFDKDWEDSGFRWHRVNAKDLISSLNQRLARLGMTTLSSSRLAQSHSRSDIDPEIGELLTTIEGTLRR